MSLSRYPNFFTPALVAQPERPPAVLPQSRCRPSRCSPPDAAGRGGVRDPAWLAPEHLPHFADVLRESGATYVRASSECVGLQILDGGFCV